MSIQWFPGHMAKARKEMSEKLKAVDMVIELRDARIPNASCNPLLESISVSKPRLVILTKKDKADPQETAKWLKHLNEKNITLAFDLNKDKLINPITSACLEVMREKHEKMRSKGINPRAIRAMVVGIPNVGKSTLINRLAKRKVAQTANKPGVTRALKLIVVNETLQLIDTPGVLWPKFDDQITGMYLALTGAINDEAILIDDVLTFGLERLIESYPEKLIERYDIKVTLDSHQVLESIAKNRGYITTKGLDLKRTIDSILKDIRNDQLGPLTWELYHE
ncbi:MAG: ribosome biogenesis GTPase YlqF [Erysipelotrichaceae bacterium]|nr:ribosome biogenesis GTPase YlqF [Erysipelotrichaceae bacterium]